MIAFEYLALLTRTTAGVITDLFDFTDGVEAALESYAPAVAGRSPSALGSTYLDVTDPPMVIYVLGDTPALCTRAAGRLLNLLDQVARWSESESGTTAVILAARIQGSAQDYEATLLNIDASNLIAAPEFDVPVARGRWAIRAELTITRRGLWLYAAADAAVISAAATAGQPWSVTLPNHDTLSPCDLRWSLSAAPLNNGQTYILQNSLLVLSQSVAVATALTAPPGGSVPAATANANAVGGSYQEFTGVGQGVATVAAEAPGLYLVIAAARVPTIGGAPGRLRAGYPVDALAANINPNSATRTAIVPVTPLSNSTIPIILGTLEVNDPVPPPTRAFSIYVYPGAASSIIIDYVVIVRITDMTQVIAFDSVAVTEPTPTVYQIINARYGGAEAAITPRVAKTTATTYVATQSPVSFGWRGDATILQRGTALVGVWMCTNSVTGPAGPPLVSGPYRIVDQATGNPLSTTFTVTRTRAALMPE